MRTQLAFDHTSGEHTEHKNLDCADCQAALLGAVHHARETILVDLLGNTRVCLHPMEAALLLDAAELLRKIHAFPLMYKVGL